MSVDLAGIVTNDSLGYLRRSTDPLAAGFISQGYRQAAYPLIMALSNATGELLGWDRIFGMALLQRSLLLVVLATVIWALRWWSVPIGIFTTSATYVVHVDFLLPEGMLIPLSMLCAALLATAVTQRTGREPRAVLLAACLAAAIAASVKLQYVVLLLLGVATAWLLVRDHLVGRRFAILTVGGALSFVAALGSAQSIENHKELGVFEPVSERARAEWYGAWVATFLVDRDNVSDPTLTRFYADGNLYEFLHGVEAAVPDYVERAEIIRDRVDRMFAAAGTSARAEQAQAFVGALGGGRTDDLRGVVDRVLNAQAGDAATRLMFNQSARDDGTESVVDGLNGGIAPGVVTARTLADVTQRLFRDFRPWKGTIALLSIGFMVAGLFVRGRHRPAAVSILLMLVTVSGALASGYIDNARYLLGPLTVAAIGGVLRARSISQVLAARLRRPGQ